MLIGIDIKGRNQVGNQEDSWSQSPTANKQQMGNIQHMAVNKMSMVTIPQSQASETQIQFNPNNSNSHPTSSKKTQDQHRHFLNTSTLNNTAYKDGAQNIETVNAALALVGQGPLTDTIIPVQVKTDFKDMKPFDLAKAEVETKNEQDVREDRRISSKKASLSLRDKDYVSERLK